VQRHPFKARAGSPEKRLAGRWLFAVALGVIAAATLAPLEENASFTDACVICGPLGGVDFILNVLIFLPIGIAIVMIGGRVRTAILVGGIITLTIESLQWRVIAGRDASLGDLLANTIGSAFGAWLATRAWRWLRLTGASAFNSTVLSALAASAIMVISATLLVPAGPPGPTFVQWAPASRTTVPFSGRLIAAELNGVSLRPTQWLQPAWSPDLMKKRFVLRASLVAPASSTSRRAVVLRVANPMGAETLMLAHVGEHLVFRSHTLASRFRLRSPVVVLRAAFRAGETRKASGMVMLETISNPRAIALRTSQENAVNEVTVRRTVGMGWVLIAPRDFALTESWWVASALWLGILVFPVGYFAGRSGTSDRGLARSAWLPPAFVLLGIVVATAVVGLSPPAPGEAFGLMAGTAAGWRTGRFLPAES
jgi:hypothetical protein